MTEQEKICRAKKEIKGFVLLSSFYSLFAIMLFFDSFFLSNEEPINFAAPEAIFFYVIIALALVFSVVNVIRLKSPKSIRNKAIRDSDERFIQIQRQANSGTNVVMALVLFIGMMLSVPLNSIELFGFSLIALILMVVVHSIIKLVLKKRY